MNAAKRAEQINPCFFSSTGGCASWWPCQSRGRAGNRTARVTKAAWDDLVLRSGSEAMAREVARRYCRLSVSLRPARGEQLWSLLQELLTLRHTRSSARRAYALTVRDLLGIMSRERQSPR